MEPEFAAALADLRLAQTARLLEWMLAQEVQPHAISRALGAVGEAREFMAELLPDGEALSSPDSPAVR